MNEKYLDSYYDSDYYEYPEEQLEYIESTLADDDVEPTDPSVMKPLGAALIGALLGGWITDAFPIPGDDQRTKIQKSQKMTAAFLASGFVGLLIGMYGR